MKMMGASNGGQQWRSLWLFFLLLLLSNAIDCLIAAKRVQASINSITSSTRRHPQTSSSRTCWHAPLSMGLASACRNFNDFSNAKHSKDTTNEFHRFLAHTKGISRVLPSYDSRQHPSVSSSTTLPIDTVLADRKVQTVAKKKKKQQPGVRPLTFFETMVCGAVSRSIAQTTMHPANTMKTLLQRGTATGLLLTPSGFPRLFRGAGANFLLSIPHGAINFAVLELIRSRLSTTLDWGAGVDFASSCIATITCSVVSTPQMMICDNIMAGNYDHLVQAITGLASQKGLAGFYTGWWPGLVGKIPSYALTWTFFQQLKRIRNRLRPDRDPTDLENSAMGSMASAMSVCLMIPVDTIKTRLVTQGPDRMYNGIVDCAVKTFRNEGLRAFYRGLPPRLISVVPMIGIQFGVYEFMKKVMLKRQVQAIQEEERRQQQTMLEGDLAVEGTE